MNRERARPYRILAEGHLGPTYVTSAVTGDDLAEEGDFLHALGGELPAFGDDVGDGAAALLAAGVGDDAEGAILVAALHDADKGGDGFFRVAVEQMLADGRFAARLRRHVHDLFLPSGQQVVQVIRRAMKFLRADDQVDVRQAVDEFPSTALGHAAEEAEDDVGAVASEVADEGGHFADGLLLGEIADAAGVEQDDVGHVLGRGEGVALGDELGGDGFAVALVHLATVGLDVNARHGLRG